MRITKIPLVLKFDTYSDFQLQFGGNMQTFFTKPTDSTQSLLKSNKKSCGYDKYKLFFNF